jgi:hypothetical protein
MNDESKLASYVPRVLVEILLPWMRESPHANQVRHLEGAHALQSWLETLALDMASRPEYRRVVDRAQVIKAIAIACHQQNKAWCEAHGDFTQVDWNQAPAWQTASAIDGVDHALKGATPEQIHENWTRLKVAEGWVYGAEKDPEKKTHHCLVPYSDLPEVQKRKDALFIAMVNQLALAFGITTEVKNT